MPNGGADNCGECQFNPSSTTRHPSHAYGLIGSCEIRGIEGIERPLYTYCANFDTGERVPDGPVFAGFYETGRLPWHGPDAVRLAPETDGFLLTVHDGENDRMFVDAADDLAWWKTAHPGEAAEYPWRLHDPAYAPEHRAAQRERLGLIERLSARIRR
jgi:hypothetical protein